MIKFRCEKCGKICYSSSEENIVCELENCKGKLIDVTSEGLSNKKKLNNQNNKNKTIENIII